MVKCSREREKGVKQVFNRKLIKFGSPKRLWDDCLTLESYIKFNTMHGIYKLDGEVTETILPRAIFDISQFL